MNERIQSREVETLEVLVPVFNEETSVQVFHDKLLGILGEVNCTWRVIYINDGSTDETEHILDEICLKTKNAVVLTLSRNFGHQAALSAGLDYCKGDVVITMDSDGEHPPSMIPEMLQLYRMGYDIVQMQRSDNGSPRLIKKWSARMFYTLLSVLSQTPVHQGASDFRLISKEVLHALRQMPEYHRYLRGMVAWLGFRWVLVPYKPDERISGRSKYNFKKMVKLAVDAIFSFSLIPLFIGLFVGIGFLLLAVLEAVYVLQFWIRGDVSTIAPGWSSLMFMLLIIGGTTSILLGIIGMYIGYIFQEVKRRPIYLLKSTNTSS